MKKKLYILLFIWFSASGFNAVAQTNNDAKAIKMVEEAKIQIRNRNFDPAFLLLNKAIRRDSNLATAYLILGNLQKFFGRETLAIAAWSKFVAHDPNANQALNLYFTLGTYALKTGNYNASQTYLQTYLAMVKSYKSDNPDTNIARRYLKSAIFAQSQNLGLPAAAPLLLPRQINIKLLQYFPSLTSDENTLLFTAADGLRRNNNEDLFIAHRKDKQWMPAVPLPENINTESNEGACFISGDGRTLVFSGCERADGIGRCDLYISQIQNNVWSNPKNITAANSVHWDSQPTLSADGRTMYFVSDRPGGSGKTDIWFSTISENKQWSAPQNLGPIINTDAAEYAPSLHANGKTLFFSSDGHPGYGGQDIFVSNLEPNGWSQPINLGKTVNSFEDETGFCLSADGQTAYISLQRNDQTGHLASAMIANINSQPTWKPAVAAFSLQVITRQTQTQKPLAAEIELRNSNTGTLIYKVFADPATGQSLMTLPGAGNYSLFASFKNHTFFSKNFIINASSTPTTLLVAMLSPLKAGASINLENILFETGKHDLSSESLAELQTIAEFMKKNQGLHIRIQAHTDDWGSQADNLSLSQARAKAVVNWLSKQGIDIKRMEWKGFGETQKTANNKTDAGRQANRRVELLVL